MVSSQTKYIGIGTIISISLLLSWFVSRPDFKVEFSPDLYCRGDCINPYNSDCINYFNITSLNKKFYIRNQGNINIPFTEPEKVRSFQVYRADLRFKTDNPNRWKEFNFSKRFTLQVNKTNEFRINLCKFNEYDEIKWGMKGFGIDEDPIFFGINISIIKGNCHAETSYNRIDTYIYSTFFYNQSRCNEDNTTCSVVSYLNETIRTGLTSYNELINTTICENTGFQIDRRKINFSKSGCRCKRDNFIISCDSCNDGNCDGVITSGESYCLKADIRNLMDVQSRLDARSMKEIKIEN